MLERHIQFHWFTAALNAKRNDVSRISVSGEQIGKFDFAVKRIDVVAILIYFVVCDCGDDVAHLQASLHRGRVWLDICDINAAPFPFFSCKLTQLRVARWEKREAGRGKTAIIPARGFLQKMRDDWGGDGVEQLGT